MLVGVGLALLLCLAVFPASAQTTIDVSCDTTELVAAITTANGTPEADTLNLSASCIYSFTTADVTNSDSALPRITTPITINGNGATFTRSGGLFRFFYIASSGNLILKDVSLTGGGGASFNDNGGAVAVIGGTLTLMNSTLSGNHTAQRAGALIVNDSGTANVINSVVSGNSASFGGGLYTDNGGTLNVINSVISGNSCTLNGGGILNSATANVMNSTISGNYAPFFDGLGGIYSTGTLTVTNSIVWGNSAFEIGDFGGVVTGTVTYSTVEGGYTGTGNLDVDPLFVNPVSVTPAPTTAGDYRLQDSSSAKDSGDNTALPVDTADLDGDLDTAELLPIDLLGNARVSYEVVDRGAYENLNPLNRLTNVSFETAGTTTKKALGWTAKNPTSTDRRLCSTVAKPITTANGACVFQFSVNAVPSSARSLKQLIAAPSWSASAAGNTLTLSAQLEASKLKSGAKMTLVVTYTDNTTAKVIAPIARGTYAFTELSRTLALTKPVSKVTITFSIGKVMGRLRIDSVNLTLTPTAPRAVDSAVRDGASALPFPDAPDGFRGGN